MNEVIAIVFGQIAKHWDIVQLVIDAIETHHVDEQQLVETIKASMTAASDAEMHRELG